MRKGFLQAYYKKLDKEAEERKERGEKEPE